MRQHQRQGPFECKLASFAILGDIPLAEVRAVACQAAGVSRWSDVMRNWDAWDAFWRGIDALHAAWPAVPTIVMTQVQIHVPTGQTPTSWPPPKPTATCEVIVWFPEDVGHSVAFVDGRIYDPDYPDPESWEAFFARIATLGATRCQVGTDPVVSR